MHLLFNSIKLYFILTVINSNNINNWANNDGF